MAERLPGGVTKNSKLPPLSGFPMPSELSSMATESLGSPSSVGEQISNGPNGLLASNGPSSVRIKAGHPEVGKNGSRLPEAESCHEAEWVEQDEPGVYITLTALPGGARDLKRVRFRYILLILCKNQSFVWFSFSLLVCMNPAGRDSARPRQNNGGRRTGQGYTSITMFGWLKNQPPVSIMRLHLGDIRFDIWTKGELRSFTM
jgi:hypothetical protein